MKKSTHAQAIDSGLSYCSIVPTKRIRCRRPSITNELQNIGHNGTNALIGLQKPIELCLNGEEAWSAYYHFSDRWLISQQIVFTMPIPPIGNLSLRCRPLCGLDKIRPKSRGDVGVSRPWSRLRRVSLVLVHRATDADRVLNASLCFFEPPSTLLSIQILEGT